MNNQVLEQKIINEEYKIWKKNVPYLYDLMFCHTLQWPSLSVQWFPDVKRDEEGGRTVQRLLLSTHTSGVEDEYIMIAQVEFPDEFDESQNEEVNGDMRFKIVQRISIMDEANRVRYSPFACNVLAVRSDLSDIHVYDYTKHLSHEKIPRPDMVLRGHEGGGFGLSWSPQSSGELASCGEDKQICVFDISQESSLISPTVVLRRHRMTVNDCSFSFLDKGLLSSGGDDGMVVFWDTRSRDCIHAIEEAHTSDVLSVRFSPLDGNIVSTSSGDKSVKVWDRRNLEQPLHILLGHSKEVLSTEWSPHDKGILASGSTDRRVIIWDLNRIGAEVSEEYKAEGPPEMRFLHGGHTSTVCDLSWNPAEPFEIVSVSEDNMLQIWQVPRTE
ncbi:putative histone acetyltransferase [Encephalitozoon intestinalis ATCC 50506]|uniref:Histone acetyltransferase n=1 Tax=Encephalitozoon intestinalis (strain ATCC 50506) TaxID=876142 RepID=E0S7Z8_ENCIT|nr:putative histone acetyltransferase [Encephalitozoon intestinalis ATCC 50506]ADM11833.1 putative histone acetyltransferase [Encephalitozoon intestinalis ATCC 50506]UTX45583.1 histone-binding protein RBBP4 [Encephalitozoon intestinalis]